MDGWPDDSSPPMTRPLPCSASPPMSKEILKEDCRRYAWATVIIAVPQLKVVCGSSWTLKMLPLREDVGRVAYSMRVM